MTLNGTPPVDRSASNGRLSAAQSITVAERMSSPPITVPSDAPIGIVSALLERHGITGLPVVDPAGALVGVISEVDVARVSTIASKRIPRELLVRHVMSAPAVTVLASASTALAGRRMERHGVRRLVVVAEDDDLQPIGVVTAADLAKTRPAGEARGATDA
jgi:CBS domain-containing protein